MKINNFVTDPDVRARWDQLTVEQQKQLNDAFKRSHTAKANFDKYVKSNKPPAVIKNERQRKLWHKMDTAMRETALMDIEGMAMLGANVAGALTGELETDN